MKRAFSLVEMLVVVAVVAIVASVLGLAVSSRLHASAEVTEVKSRLRQLAMSVNLYMADNGDHPPPSLKPVANGMSIRDPRNGGVLLYTLARVATARQTVDDFEEFGFNASADSIVKCPGLNDWHGATETLMVHDGSGRLKPFEVPILGANDKLHLLGVRLDGSIGWFEPIEPWESKLPQLPPIGPQ